MSFPEEIPLPPQIEIETVAYCNRVCPSCLRNSDEDREAWRAWFDKSERMPTEEVRRILVEARAQLGCSVACLQHFGEPLVDDRIAGFARFAKQLGYAHAFVCTNADFLTEEMARELDGALDQMFVSLYDERSRAERQAWIAGLFSRTDLVFTDGAHVPTHFSPVFDVARLTRSNRSRPCHEPLRRMIVNHRGEMLLCCDDGIGRFGLGNVRDASLRELWFSERHRELVRALLVPGGRSVHPHCESCPRA